jgi:hypothetical protein
MPASVDPRAGRQPIGVQSSMRKPFKSLTYAIVWPHGMTFTSCTSAAPASRDPGLLYRRPDCARVCRVSFVCLHKRPNEFCVQQDDVVTQGLDLSRPPVSASACLQRDSAGGSAAQVLNQIVAPELSIHDLTHIRVDPVHLENALRNIQSVRCGIHRRTPS